MDTYSLRFQPARGRTQAWRGTSIVKAQAWAQKRVGRRPHVEEGFAFSEDWLGKLWVATGDINLPDLFPALEIQQSIPLFLDEVFGRTSRVPWAMTGHVVYENVVVGPWPGSYPLKRNEANAGIPLRLCKFDTKVI